MSKSNEPPYLHEEFMDDFATQVALARMSGAKRVSATFSGGHDSGDIDSVTVFLTADECCSPGTYDSGIESLCDRLSNVLYDEFGGFNNEPVVDGSFELDLEQVSLTASADLSCEVDSTPPEAANPDFDWDAYYETYDPEYEVTGYERQFF